MANIVNDAINARQAGAAELQGFTEGLAQKRAGRNMVSGNLQGAAADLYGAGMLDAGAGVERIGEQRQDRAATQAKDAESQQKARQAESLKFMAQAARVLRGIPQDKRGEAYTTSIAPALKSMGADDATITQAGQHLDDNSLNLFSGEVEKQLKFFEGPDGIYSANEATGDVKNAMPFAPKREAKWVERTLPGGATEWVDLNAGGGSQGGSPAQGLGGGFQSQIGPLLQREGGFVAQDGASGAPANFGINQRANPDIDVKNLTKEQAAQLYKERYWDAINGDQLPPEAQAAVFDSAVNQGVGAAQQMWAQAGGDVDKFNELRLQRYRQTPGYDKYGKAWERRVAETGGGQSLAGGSRNDTLTPGAVRGSAPKRGKEVESASAQELIAAGYPPGTRAQVDRATGEFKNIKQPTESQTKAAAFTRRVLDANDRLNALAAKGTFKPSPQLLISEKNGVTRLVASNPTDRQFVQAAKEWLAPILRKDTGAAVTDSEMIVYMDMYIPRPEDDVGTLRQKANARQSAMIALAQESGGVFDATYGNRKFKSFMPSESRKREESSNTFDTDAGQVTVRPR